MKQDLRTFLIQRYRITSLKERIEYNYVHIEGSRSHVDLRNRSLTLKVGDIMQGKRV